MMKVYIVACLAAYFAVEVSGNCLDDLMADAMADMTTNVTEFMCCDPLVFKTIPSTVGLLTSLTSLDLGDCSITGKMPTSIKTLSDLTEFVVNDNDLTGNLPAQIGDLSSLTLLDVNHNHLQGALPDMSKLVSLRKVFLDHNELTGTAPSSFVGLASLRLLFLSKNDFSGTLPSVFGPDLSIILLDNNDFSGSIPDSLATLKSLQILYLQNNKLSKQLPATMGKDAQLHALLVSNNELTGPIPSNLSSASKLTTLALSDNQLSGVIPAGLASLPKLARISLKNNRLVQPLPAFRETMDIDITSADLNFVATGGECASSLSMCTAGAAMCSATTKRCCASENDCSGGGVRVGVSGMSDTTMYVAVGMGSLVAGVFFVVAMTKRKRNRLEKKIWLDRGMPVSRSGGSERSQRKPQMRYDNDPNASQRSFRPFIRPDTNRLDPAMPRFAGSDSSKSRVGGVFTHHVSMLSTRSNDSRQQLPHPSADDLEDGRAYDYSYDSYEEDEEEEEEEWDVRSERGYSFDVSGMKPQAMNAGVGGGLSNFLSVPVQKSGPFAKLKSLKSFTHRPKRQATVADVANAKRMSGRNGRLNRVGSTMMTSVSTRLGRDRDSRNSSRKSGRSQSPDIEGKRRQRMSTNPSFIAPENRPRAAKREEDPPTRKGPTSTFW